MKQEKGHIARAQRRLSGRVEKKKKEENESVKVLRLQRQSYDK